MFEKRKSNIVKFSMQRKISHILRRSGLSPILYRSKFVIKLARKLNLIQSSPLVMENHNAQEIVIMGKPVISKTEWTNKKNFELQKRIQKLPSYTKMKFTKKDKPGTLSENNSSIQMSVIASVYRPGDLFDSFLGNIKEQSIFHQTEIIIILVDPLPAEIELATKFADAESNVHLELISSRITIYEAWNLALSKCSTEFLTNMNVDDIRSPKSLETQLMFMQARPWVDVGYQDFFYLLDRDLDWDSIVNVGALSDLPPVTLTGLAWFGINPPHNGPIWRRDLHDRFGNFDERFRSAGDYEFWMRVISNRAIFAKMEDSTVGYFLNPDGMSTAEDSPSTSEEKLLAQKYRAVIDISSEKYPILNLPDRYQDFPWEGADLLTISALDELKRFEP